MQLLHYQSGTGYKAISKQFGIHYISFYSKNFYLQIESLQDSCQSS